MTGIGLGAHGVATPLPGTPRRHDHRLRADLCAAFGHPAVTFNPWHNRSWCQCGRAVSEGNAVEWPKPTDCGGYLVDCEVAA